MHIQSLAAAVVLAGSINLMAGCGGDTAAIRTYEVARETTPRKRMLAAMVRRGDTTWFFKLTGPDRAVTEEVDAFVEFIRNLEFDATGKPKWEAFKRGGWFDATGSPQRLATLRKAVDDGVLDFGVSSLPTRGDWQQYVLQNVNRWRRQLHLAPLSADELSDQVIRIALKRTVGAEAITVNIVESDKARDATETPAVESSPAPAAAAGSSAIRFDVPKNWRPTTNNAFSRYAFVVEDEATDSAAKITLTPLGAAAGRQLLANVNRWRQQLGMPPISEMELGQVTEPIKLLGVDGWLVDLVPDGEGRDGILGAVAVARGQAWFIKMAGESALLRKEKETFRQFVQSMRFE